MPSLITTVKASSYLRPPGMEAIPLGARTEAELELIRKVFEAGRASRRIGGGRPTDEDRVLEILRSHPELKRRLLLGDITDETLAGTPRSDGRKHVSPTEAVEGFLADLLKEVEAGTLRHSTYIVRRDCLRIMLKEEHLGGASWSRWMSFWPWLHRTYANDNYRSNFCSSANLMISWSQRKDVQVFIPDFKPLVDRPRRTASMKMRDQAAQGDAVPYTIEEARSLLAAIAAVDLPLYMRLGEYVCAFTGLSVKDMRNLLAGKTPDGTKATNGSGFRMKDGQLWYTNRRHKSAVPIDIPIAPALATILKPHMCRFR